MKKIMTPFMFMFLIGALAACGGDTDTQGGDNAGKENEQAAKNKQEFNQKIVDNDNVKQH
ncbi:hypothetical protein [Pueribacillus sp. YX66]|uniref:hypothetical protein n=1 Tax=Pueribacillus sp. YX66 TaxID=3229242 RepID=UPI00358D5810